MSKLPEPLMLILRDPADVALVADPAIGRLLALRFAQLSQDEPYDPEIHGYFVVVEAGDTVASLEGETGCWIFSGLFSDAAYGDPDFTPSFECLEEHSACYEMVFILNDGGFGVLFAIPKQGIDPRLLAYCQEYAVPAICP